MSGEGWECHHNHQHDWSEESCPDDLISMDKTLGLALDGILLLILVICTPLLLLGLLYRRLGGSR